MNTNNTFPVVDWTSEDQERAESEGWGIFEPYSGAGQEIEADSNDSDIFVRDGVSRDAVEHVCREALAGSNFHVRALVIHCRDAIDIFKAAYGYGEDDQIPEKQDDE
jgi:hypothetical protein